MESFSLQSCSISAVGAHQRKRALFALNLHCTKRRRCACVTSALRSHVRILLTLHSFVTAVVATFFFCSYRLTLLYTPRAYHRCGCDAMRRKKVLSRRASAARPPQDVPLPVRQGRVPAARDDQRLQHASGVPGATMRAALLTGVEGEVERPTRPLRVAYVAVLFFLLPEERGSTCRGSSREA